MIGKIRGPKFNNMFIYIEDCSVHVPVPVQVNMGPGRKARKVPVPYMWTA